ncbi:MAG: DNA topoisomerase IV subunit A [bacterium]|nr:DNA topoisomerase IV subunit A [bacterium]
MTRVEPLMRQNFLEYASYVIVDRAIPDIRDGLKPVQRRILTTLFRADDGKFHKVANIIGSTMKLHPHGDASIGDALVVLANKDYFIEKQGNFGNPVTGHSSAAPRYIECRLTDLARETLFFKALTQYQPSYDGRGEEPVFLPAKLPVALLLGAEGIAVGMSTRILSHNITELLNAQISILEGEPFEILPDFMTGGLMDVSEYDDGRGKIRIRARIERKDDKTVVIREIPSTTTTEGLIASMETAAQKGKVKISSIDDFTTDTVEIEVGLARGVYADEVIPQLYAHTDCEVSISSNILLIRDRGPAELTVSEVLTELTQRLREQIKAEMEYELGLLEDKKHWLTLERIFIENRLYKRIENAKTMDAVKFEVYAGLEAYRGEIERAVTDEDIDRLLKIPIRRISQFDIDRSRKDLDETNAAIKAVTGRLHKLTKTTIAYLQELLEKYGDLYPRCTEVTPFETVNVRAVARQNLKISYDPETGFFGTEVKGEKYQLNVSEYDRILLMSKDGTYRIIGVEAKVLIPSKVIHVEVFDQDEGSVFTVVFRDSNRIAWAKKVHIKGFIKDKEYRLIKDPKGRVDMLMQGLSDDTVHFDFVPAKRQRVHNGDFDLSILDVVGVGAMGRRLSPKPIARLKRIRSGAQEKPDEKPKTEEPAPEPNPDQVGLFGDDEG